MRIAFAAAVALASAPALDATAETPGQRTERAQAELTTTAGPTCALVSIKDSGSAVDVAGVVDAVYAEVTRIQACQLQPDDITRAKVASAGALGLTCTLEDVECLRRLAVLLEVDRVLAARVRPDADQANLSLTCVDETSGLRIGEWEGLVPREGPMQARRTREAVGLVLQPERWLGRLRLRVAPRGARILIDGIEVGTSPLPGAVRELAIGAHRVEVHHDGHEPFDTRVEVAAGQLTRLEVQLQPRAEPADEPLPTMQSQPDLEPISVKQPSDSPTAEEHSTVIAGGWIAAGVGAGLAALGGAAAIVLDQLLADPESIGVAEERESMWIGGRVALAVSLTGIIVGVLGLGTAVGAVDLGTGPPEEGT